MENEFHTGYQYDRCSSRGICSINPTTSSLQEVILLYLKLTAFYGLKLKEAGYTNNSINNLIINTIAILGSNYEISENNFSLINSSFKIELPEIIKKYEEIFSKSVHSEILSRLNACNNLNDYIRLGEKEFNNRIQKILTEERSLYRILFILVKSNAINILTYESFGKGCEKEVYEIFKVLNLLNSSKIKKEELKKIIVDLSKSDCELMKKIRAVQEELYGIQDEYDVSFSTKKGKAILVVGSNLRELEQILDEFSGEDIDIYTHDNMILAHTFPKFKEYKNLKGQYGHGMESCLLDFSTFPGPILLTRHSLFNVENLYRGRLFTTDFSYSKGVIPIKNNDFSEVLKSLRSSRGFKSGKICEDEKIGFSYIKTVSDLMEKFSNKTYNHVVIISAGGYSEEEQKYLHNLIKRIPKDTLIVSFSCCANKENLICLNASFDIYSILLLSEKILGTCKKCTLFFPSVDRHTLSMIINLKTKSNEIFIGSWNKTVINPNIIESLKEEFNIKEMTTPKKDADNIINLK